jgi:hypothetical protein
MTVTPFGPARGHWRERLRSGRLSHRFDDRKNGPGKNRGRFFGSKDPLAPAFVDTP